MKYYNNMTSTVYSNKFFEPRENSMFFEPPEKIFGTTQTHVSNINIFESSRHVLIFEMYVHSLS
jgi:hypothetical protein